MKHMHLWFQGAFYCAQPNTGILPPAPILLLSPQPVFPSYLVWLPERRAQCRTIHFKRYDAANVHQCGHLIIALSLTDIHSGASIPYFPNYRLGPVDNPGQPCTPTVSSIAGPALHAWLNPASRQRTLVVEALSF